MLTAGLCQGPDIRTLKLTCYGYSHVTQVGTAWLLEALPGPFCGQILLYHVPCHGGTKADAIKPNKFKVQPMKQVSSITSVD